MAIAQLSIEGMHCGGCVARAVAALKALPSVVVQSAAVGAITAAYDDTRVTANELTAALERLGYDARLTPSVPAA